MLIVSRKREEGLRIGGQIEIKILGVTESDKNGRKIRSASIGIEAPREIAILRRELVETRNANVAAAESAAVLPLAGIAGLLGQKRSILPLAKPEDRT